MKQFSQKYVLAHIIKDLPDGFEYSMKQWPLHVTLADVFAIKGDVNDLIHSLKVRLASIEPPRVTVKGDEWFGADKSVHVRLLDKTEAIQILHEIILEVLNEYHA